MMKRKATELDASTESPVYPQVHWAANDRALIWDLIEVLRENDYLRKSLWPMPGEATTGMTKIECCERITFQLFAGNKAFAPYMFVDYAEGDENSGLAEDDEDTRPRNQAGIRHYANTLKLQLAGIQKAWRKAHETLGQTGQGLNSADDIIENTPLMQTWQSKVIRTCPFYYELKEMLGERLLVTKDAVSNSSEKLQVHDALNLGCKNSTASEFPANTQANRDLAGLLKTTEFEPMLSSREASRLQDSRPVSRMRSSITLPTTPAPNTRQRGSCPPDGKQHPRSHRTRGSANNLGDFAEGIRAISAINANARLERHREKEEAARLNIMENYDLEKQRLKLDIARLKLDVARFKAESRRANRGQQIRLLLRQQELDIEREKANLPPLENKQKVDFDSFFDSPLDEDMLL